MVWDILPDADPANNPFNWQWVAGSGIDAAPYFRVCNPDTQQHKFEPGGLYVNRWAPQSEKSLVLIDLSVSRVGALAVYDKIKDSTQATTQ